MASYDIIVKLVDQTKTGLRNIESGLTTIQSRAEQVNKTLDKLGSGLERAAKISSAALTAAAASAINFADNMSDTAKAADMSTAALIGLSKAFEQNGGTSDKAQQAALRFAQTIGDAASGSKVARDALDKVGISLSDIANVPTDELLGRTVAQLSNFGDQSKAASVSADIFGKVVKGVDFKGVSDSLADLTAQSKQYEGAVDSAANLVDNFNAALGSVKLAILQVIKPAIDFINALGTDRLSAIAQGVAGIGAAIIGLKVATGIVGFIVDGFGKLSGILSTAAKAVSGFGVVAGTATVVTGGLAAAELTAAGAFAAVTKETAFLTGAIGRLGRANTTLLVAQAELNAMVAEGTITGAAYQAQLNKVAAAESALAIRKQALTATQAEFNALQTAGVATSATAGAAAATNVGIFARLGAAMSAVAAAAAPIAIVLAAITAAIAVGTVIYRAFEDEIDGLLGTMWDFAKAVGGGIKDAVVGFFDWANSGLTSLAQKLRNVAAAIGLASNKDVVQAQANKAAPDQSAAETKRLAEAASAAKALRDVVNVTMKAINDSIETAVGAAKDLGQSISAGAIDAARSAAVYDKLSSTMLMFGEVIKKPTDLIKRDFNIALAKNREEIRQNGIILADTKLVYAEFANELDKAGQEIDKQAIRLGNSALVSRQYQNEINSLSLALKDFQDRQANIGLQEAILTDELERAASAAQKQAAEIEDASTANSRFAIETQNAANAIRAETLLLGDSRKMRILFGQEQQKTENSMKRESVMLEELRNAYSANTISLKTYLEMISKYSDVLLTPSEIADKYIKSSQDELAVIDKKKLAFDELIKRYRAGDIATKTFQETAKAIGAATPQIRAVTSELQTHEEKIQEYNDAIKESINSATDTFVTEFTSAFMKGEGILDSFKNFFSNVMNDIAQRIIKKQLTEPIADALNGMLNDVMKSTGGIGSVLSGIFSNAAGGGGSGFFGNIGSALGGIASSIGSFFGFANGGMIGAGQTGLVGENGPEYITGPANITPMDQTGSKDKNPIINFNIQAIDTQTGVQFLLQNKPAIVSMVSQAYNERGRRGVNG